MILNMRGLPIRRGRWKGEEMERRISKAGSVNIPLHLRRELSIEPGEKVDIYPQEDGSIAFDRIEGTCIFCGDTKKVQSFKSRFVCGKCRKELSE